jgi:hypothetical protein
MVVNVQSLGIAERIHHRLKLLSDHQAVALLLDHLDDLGQMALSTPQPLDDFGMSPVYVHSTLPLRMRYDDDRFGAPSRKPWLRRE